MLENTFNEDEKAPPPFFQGLFWMPIGTWICNFSLRNLAEQVRQTANVVLPLFVYKCIGKARKYWFFTRFDLKSILNSHINLNNQLSGIFWTFLWPSRQFSKILTSMRGVCGPQNGVNLGQNECFLSILKERKGTIDFKTWITDLIAYYQPCLNQISTFQNYRSHCGGSVGPKGAPFRPKWMVFVNFKGKKGDNRL